MKDRNMTNNRFTQLEEEYWEFPKARMTRGKDALPGETVRDLADRLLEKARQYAAQFPELDPTGDQLLGGLLASTYNVVASYRFDEGEIETALQLHRDALQLSACNAHHYENYMAKLVRIGRLSEAAAVANEMP